MTWRDVCFIAFLTFVMGLCLGADRSGTCILSNDDGWHDMSYYPQGFYDCEYKNGKVRNCIPNNDSVSADWGNK